MAKKYKYIDGVKYEVVPNYELGSDVVAPEGSGGSDLPEYSAADAGRVLSVDSEGSGLEWKELNSNSIVGIPLLYNDETYEYYLEKTYSEIAALIRSGVAVYLIDTTGVFEGEGLASSTGFGVIGGLTDTIIWTKFDESVKIVDETHLPIYQYVLSSDNTLTETSWQILLQ